ncbi:neuropeptide receptor 22-like [Physella acuta]|uniref:neuropeptide receptor 22-like n=1 Tax=Physella acuta TaxID=109671 RepID=UPI0027DAD466|nr:neuropeptide receptor 22-like [Physella acuta]
MDASNDSKAVEGDSQLLINDEVESVFNLLNNATLLFIITFCGVVFNVINIIVFIKMGFSDSVNMSLLGLSVADLWASAILLVCSVCNNPVHAHQYGVIGVFLGWPHITMVRVSSWLTVFITFERYLCVAFPLKVKSIITPSRTRSFIIIVFIIFTVASIPPLSGMRLEWVVLDEETNESGLSFYFTPGGKEIENASFTFSNVSLLSSFPCVIVFTFLIVVKLEEKSKWRKQTSSMAQKDTTSARDTKVVKMIILISGIFIFCYMPAVTSIAGALAYAEYNATGRLKNFFIVCWSFVFCLEATNATVTMFVYLKMSTKYRSVFLSIFRCSPQE